MYPSIYLSVGATRNGISIPNFSQLHMFIKLNVHNKFMKHYSFFSSLHASNNENNIM